MQEISRILEKSMYDPDDIRALLNTDESQQKLLFIKANEVKNQVQGNKVYFRGLIEFSNVCAKDCLYCGIRRSNSNVLRYNLSDDEILDAALFAHEKNYASIVLQSGEIASKSHTNRIESLLKKIYQKTNGKLRVTLSLGEQSDETYKRWFDSGAQRYLIRIETTNRELYKKIHPDNEIHNFNNRLKALEFLKKIGYQTGTGVMIGLPFQTIDNLTDDLLFMKDFGIDMVGMGPYIVHRDTPLYEYRNQILPLSERFYLALKMIAVLRLLLPNINIAAATALQAIDKMGREKALMAGANVIMPNITPGKYRNSYKLYENKPCTDENAEDCTPCLEARIGITGNEIAYGEWGDSKFYLGRRDDSNNP
jgi:biotin synthase